MQHVDRPARAGLIGRPSDDVCVSQGRAKAPQRRSTRLSRWSELNPTLVHSSIARSRSTLRRAAEHHLRHASGHVTTLDAPLPEPANAQERRALAYMQLPSGFPLTGTPVDIVFVGSCTNGRLSDLRAAADVLRGRKVATSVRMLVVPGSEQVKRDAEREGLHDVFRAAGAEWREAGCSMCLGMNGDIGQPGQLVVSTSNRNFEGRQGPGVRTVLASPLVAAASAVAGCIADTSEFFEEAAA